MRILGPILILLALFTLAGCERETDCEKAVRKNLAALCQSHEEKMARLKADNTCEKTLQSNLLMCEDRCNSDPGCWTDCSRAAVDESLSCRQDRSDRISSTERDIKEHCEGEPGYEYSRSAMVLKCESR